MNRIGLRFPSFSTATFLSKLRSIFGVVRPAESAKPTIGVNGALILIAALACVLTIIISLPFSLRGALSPTQASTALPVQSETEKNGNLMLRTYMVPDQTFKSLGKVLLIQVPIGVEIKRLELLSANERGQTTSIDHASKLNHHAYIRSIDLPPGTIEARLTTSNDLLAPISVFVGDSASLARVQTDIKQLTTALICAQILLALFALGVAYFGKLSVLIRLASWLGVLSALSILSSGALASMVTPNIAAILELRFLGFTAALLGLATLGLQREFAEPSKVVVTKSSRWWFGVWLASLGVLSAVYPHQFFVAMIWMSGAAFCFRGSIKTLLQWGQRKNHLSLVINATAWLIGAWAILSEILPWFGLSQSKTGYSYLFPTLYSVAFSAFTLTRALGVEKRIRRDAQRQAESSLKHVAEVMENTPVAMLSANYKGRVTQANLQARNIWPSVDWSSPGKLRLDDLVGTQYAGLLSEAFKSKRSVEAIMTLPKGEQRSKEKICQIKLFRTANTLEVALIDITDQERMTRVLEDQVSTDPLTKLLNRRGLDQHLRALQALVNKQDAQASLLFIDLDRFKIVNDLYGHDYGDELLVQIALRAKAMSEGRLTIARIGGDEFVVLVPNASLDVAGNLAEELRAIISNRPYPVREKLLTVGASIGVVSLIKGMAPKDALIYADRACGQAKKSGRGRVERVEASDKMISEFRSETLLQEKMSARLPTECLRLFAQPLVPLNGRAGLAYEILLRYVDDEGKVTPPGQLISIAERQGKMSQLDFWVLENTLIFLHDHPEFAKSSLFFTVNLSGSSINDRRFLGEIMKLFERFANVANCITLEVTETVALLDTKYTRRFMDAMIAKGVRFALDDFGAGYTSFGYLKDLPATMLKIDGNFISTLALDKSCQRIVKTMSTLSQQLSMHSVAEWVEDEHTLKLLIDMQIDFAQGYFFAPAKPLDFWITSKRAIDSIQEKAQRYTRTAPPPTPKAHREASLPALV